MKKTFFKKACRELRHHKVQYILLVIIIGMGVAAYGSFSSLMDSRWETFDIIYSESKFMDVEAEFQYGIKTDIAEIDAIIEGAGISDSIEAIEYRLSYDVFILGDGTDSPMTKGQIIGYNAFGAGGLPREPDVNALLYFESEHPYYESPNAMQCFIEHKYATANGIEKGDMVRVQRGGNEVYLEVLGHVNVPEFFFVIQEGSIMPDEMSFGVIVVPNATAQYIYSGTYMDTAIANNIVIRLSDTDSSESFRIAFEDAFNENGIPVKTASKEENPSRKFMKEDMEGDQDFLTMFPVIIFVVSAIGLVMMLRRMIQSHKSQIGVFKALGISNMSVLGYFSMIGMLIALIGILMGWIFTIPINSAFKSILQEVYGFAIFKYNVTLKNYFIAASIAIVVCMACTLLPVWYSLRIKPIDAIQNREGISYHTGGRASVISRIRNIPVSTRLILRNLSRSPGKSLSTIIGVALSLMIFLAFVNMLDSMVIAIDGSNDAIAYNYEVHLEGFSSVSSLKGWESEFDDVTLVNPGLMVPTTLSHEGIRMDALLYAPTSLDDAYTLEYDSSNFDEDAMASKDSLVISFYVSNFLGIGAGDDVDVTLPFLDENGDYIITSRKMTISAVHLNIMGTYVFTDIGTIQEMTHLEGMANMAFINLDGMTRSAELENSIIQDSRVSSLANSEQTASMIEQYFDILVQVTVMMALICVILAAAIVYNLFMIGAQERKREYATMKTLGTSVNRIGRLIFGEAAVITIIGLIFGGIGGHMISNALASTLPQFELFYVDILFSWTRFVQGAGLIIGVVVIVSLLTMRYIGKIHIADVIRERSI